MKEPATSAASAHTLEDWLDFGCGGTGRGWWWLPSPARPRMGISRDPAHWPAALRMVSIRRKRLILAWMLRLMKWRKLPPHVTAPAAGTPLDRWLAEIWPDVPLHFSFYRGTPNLFVKDTIQCIAPDGTPLGYVKIPRGPEAPRMIANEAAALARLREHLPEENFYPSLLSARDGATLQSAPPAGGLEISRPAAAAGRILGLLRNEMPRLISWPDSPVRRDIAAAVADLERLNHPRVAGRMARVLDGLDRDCGGGKWPHAYSHGDFVPWNFSGGFVFDWEWADHRMPWHDAFHFLWMPRILGRRAIRAADLWNLWLGPPGASLRGGAPPAAEDALHARIYLAWQSSFYASASARSGDPAEGTGLLDRLAALMLAPPGGSRGSCSEPSPVPAT